MVATISPVEATHVIRRQGAETRAILRMHKKAGGKIDIADVWTAGTRLLSAH